MTQLKHLDLYANQFTKLPREIGRLTELEDLNIGLLCLGRMEDLCDDEFVLPKDIARLKQLKNLNLEGRKVRPSERVRLKKLFKNVTFE